MSTKSFRGLGKKRCDFADFGQVNGRLLDPSDDSCGEGVGVHPGWSQIAQEDPPRWEWDKVVDPGHDLWGLGNGGVDGAGAWVIG